MMRKWFVTLTVILLAQASVQGEQGCFSIVAGREATADGSVLYAHNEDNGRDDVAGMVKITAADHEEDTWVTLPGGGRIPQVEHTFAYWWLRMPEQDYSDAVVNEHGVVVASDNCPSREDQPEISEGGIGGPILRCLVAERARTAREGVELVGSLVERFGYTASGRTLVICDPREGWFVCLVNGKHWAAARVPDDQVAVVANTYTLGEMDLKDRDNFLACPDLVEYALKRGWYDPKEGPFRFEAAYANRGSRYHRSNIYRQWSGLFYLTADPLPQPDRGQLLFSVKPKVPLTVRDLTAVLRNHYEGTEVKPATGYEAGSPHNKPASTVCGPQTNSSSVFQLRSGMPLELGVVWWCAFWQPCTAMYAPLYPCMDAVPDLLALEAVSSDTWRFGPSYGCFHTLARWTDVDYNNRIVAVKNGWKEMEESSYLVQGDLEAFALAHWNKDPHLVRKVFDRYCYGIVARALEEARRVMGEADAK